MLLRVFQILAWLPLPLMHALGAAAGWLTYASSHTYRERMRLNLKQAGYLAALHQTIAESGKNLIELPFFNCDDNEISTEISETNYSRETNHLRSFKMLNSTDFQFYI